MENLYETLKTYKKNTYPMHMPGHKQGRLGALKKLYSIDVTEVNETDNLHNPTGILKTAMNKAAKTFGADKTYFLVNGSTVGIMATITAICKPGDSLIVARNSHRSVYDALITTGVKPIYIYPQIHPLGITGGINPNELKELLDKNPDAKGVIITSPTYDGIISDVEKIAKIVHDRNKILIVDEAHGAHFRFHKTFPKTALDCNADVVIQSTHKTLPSLTQSSMLHIKGVKIDSEAIKEALALYETSSPSYVLMTSLDNCRELLDTKGQYLFNEYVDKLEVLRKELTHLKNLTFLDKDILIGQSSIHDIDISKIPIFCRNTNITGIEVEKLLNKRYNIQIEMSTTDYILAMTTIADTIDGFNSFKKALINMDNKLNKSPQKDDNHINIKPKIRLLPREAYFSNKKAYHFNDIKNKISGSYIIPYPPGIPLVVPGEEITEEIYKQINVYKQSGAELLGLDNLKIIQE